MVGRRCNSDAYADIDLPFGRNVQVGGRKELLLLLAKRIKLGEGAVIGVILDSAAYLLAEVIADLGGGSEPSP